MEMVSQEAYFRQRVLNYAAKHGVTAAANRHHLSRKTVHKWKKRYNGIAESLQALPRTPHHFPRQQTAAELELVKRYAKKYKGDPLLGYEKARKHGYNRSYGCFKKTARKLLQPEAKKRKKRKNKPYQRAEYPGQKMQIDVKYVPGYCVVNGERNVAMSHYTHLSIEERESLLLSIGAGKTLREIARILQRSPSTLSRELKRNCENREEYSPDKATRDYHKRREKCCRQRILKDAAAKALIQRLFLNSNGRLSKLTIV